MVDFIKTKFKIRQCKTFKYKDRPCLNYHIKKCLAPCMGYISKEEYMEQINQIIDLLEGKTDKIIRQLKKEMEEASIKFEYEKAAYIRDKILAIDNISKRQKVSNLSENDIDVIGIAKSKYQVCLEMFFIRNSKMIGRKHYFLANIQDEEDSEILSSFIKQYYVGNPILPHKIMIKENIEDKEIIEKSLTEQAGRKVEIKAPQKGEKLRLVEMAENNAKITLENKEKDKTTILTELKEALSLENIPRKIECFDISNISGTNVVAGMCVMQDGVIKKNLSRRFKIKTVIGQDDPACMREVVTRRLKHSIENSEGGFGKLPDVIFADGGITQIRAIKQAISDVQKWINSELSGSVKLNIAVFGMVKDDTHSTRALIDEERNEIQISEKLMNLITNFQDQVHETAISYHRKLRDKQITKSELDEIKGIGETKKRELLKYFGSINKIREANIEEIAKIKGINLELAKTIKNKLK